MNLRRLFLLAVVSLAVSLACTAFPLLFETAAPSPQPTAAGETSTFAPLPTPTLGPEKRTLTVCAASEPPDLFLYNQSHPVKQAVFAAIYDGPIDFVEDAYHPILLEKLPSLADGDAFIETVQVRAGDLVADADGRLTPLQPGVLVRPAGCRSPECAIPYESGALDMERLRVIFHLRTDVRWEDGEPVTAWDSFFSYRVASDPETLYGNLGLASASAASLLMTADYSPLDDFTVQWTGRPGFLDPNYPLNFFHPLPEHILAAYTLTDLLESNEALYRPTAWGAYRVVDWQAGERITLEPNPAYFRSGEGWPAFDELVFRFINGDLQPVLTELRAGGCHLLLSDLFPETPPSALIEAVTAGEARLLPDPQPVFEYLLFNLAPADPALPPIFSDARTRRAAALCLDRALLTDAVYAGFAPALEFPLPSGDPLLTDASLPPLSYDPLQGAALLEEIGWRDADGDGVREAFGVSGVPDGTRLQVDLYTTDAPLRDQLARWIVFQLQSCGIEINVIQAPARDLLAQTAEAPLSGRRFQMGVISSSVGVESLCAMGMSGRISSEMNNWSGSNLSGYSNPQFDSACAAVFTSLPGEAQYRASRQEVLRYLMQDLPLLPLFVQTRFLVASPALLGLEQPGGLQNLETFRIEP